MTLTKRQNEIIDAALRLTARGGTTNLTIRNLSGEIGVTEPALYRHFKNKSEIVKAMIGRFDSEVCVDEYSGLAGVRAFVMGRIEQVGKNPDLARVMFAEELFMDDPEFSELMFEMMHRHKAALNRALRQAVAAGEIRGGLEPDTLFRILLGPVRLLIKQWGMSGGGFDLKSKGEELIEAVFSLLRPEKA